MSQTEARTVLDVDATTVRKKHSCEREDTLAASGRFSCTPGFSYRVMPTLYRFTLTIMSVFILVPGVLAQPTVVEERARLARKEAELLEREAKLSDRTAEVLRKEADIARREADLLEAWAKLRAAGVEAKPALDAALPSTSKKLAAYEEVIPGTKVRFKMVPIPGGKFRMGSPKSERKRNRSEGPVHQVEVSPFWMGAHEVTWQEYELWSASLEKKRRSQEPSPTDIAADAVTRPTPPYTDMTFGMGRKGYPAICMTQLAAKTYCEWLSVKTGKLYRLPTEAEWEFACRAGTNTAYSFGDDHSELGDYAWYRGNSQGAYHPVGKKRPNAFGLYDIHGNVAEWCLDQFDPAAYAARANAAKAVLNPFRKPSELYPRVVRGGGWRHPSSDLRSAARMESSEDWKMQDPQLPQSIWYHTDALFVGFRVVCPVNQQNPDKQ